MCRDGHAVITDNSWVILCPPTEDVASQAVTVLSQLPEVLPTVDIGMYKNHYTTLNILYAV